VPLQTPSLSRMVEQDEETAGVALHRQLSMRKSKTHAAPVNLGAVRPNLRSTVLMRTSQSSYAPAEPAAEAADAAEQPQHPGEATHASEQREQQYAAQVRMEQQQRDQ